MEIKCNDADEWTPRPFSSIGSYVVSVFIM